MIDKSKKFLYQQLRNVIMIQDKKRIIELVKNGADINYIDPIYVHNILMEFSKKVNPEIIELLISLGGNPCYSNEDTVNLFQNLAYFIHGEKHDNLDYSDVYPYLDDTKNWIKTYKVQKKCIDNFPDSLQQMYKCKILNEQIKEEYRHLISAFELNLL